jgi:hypothetical protein
LTLVDDRGVGFGNVWRECRLEDEGDEGEEDPGPADVLVYVSDDVTLRDMPSTLCCPSIVPFIHNRLQPDQRIQSGKVDIKKEENYGAAPKALLFVSSRIAENVLVMTATNKLRSQKLITTMQTMKKKQDTKYSASIIEYMSGDHYKKHINN